MARKKAVKGQAPPKIFKASNGVEFRADQLLTDKQVKNWDVELPLDWTRTPDVFGPAWPIRKGKPPASGMGYTMSPYQQFYTRVYGVTPIADLPKYRRMYRNEPDIRQAIDLQALLAAGKGFTVEHENNDVEEFLNDMLERTYVHEALFIAVKDALTYGSAFVEILWAEGTTEEETVEIPPDIVAEVMKQNHPGMKEFAELSNSGKIVSNDGKWYVSATVYKKNNVFQYLAANGKGKKDKPVEKTVYPNIAGLKPLDPCFPAGTPIDMGHELKSIDQINTGDMVLTHNGNIKPVTKLYKREYDGELVQIETTRYKSEQFQATPNHPFYIIQKHVWKQWINYTRNERKKNRAPKPLLEKFKPKWVEAGQLSLGDIMLFPIRKHVEDIKNIDFRIYSNGVEFRKTHGNLWEIDRLPINGDLMRLIGYYAAEGSCYEDGVQFSFGSDENEYANKLSSAFWSIFKIKTKIANYKNNELRVSVSSKILRNFFKDMCPGVARTKKLNKLILDLGQENQKVFLEAFIDGDGCRYNNTVTCASASPYLAHQIREIALRCGYAPSLEKKDWEGPFGKGIYYNIIWREKPNRIFGYLDKSYFGLRINNISRKTYKGPVFNIEVKDDNSYCLPIGAVHNCYMRVRRDAFGNVYGYIQWLSFPPVIIKPEDLLHFKYSPTSEGYASCYGQSVLMPLIKNNDLLNQFENDMAVWMHNQVVLPTIFKGGTAEKPYTRDMMVDLMSKFANRTNSTNMFVRGDVEVIPLQGAAKNIKVDWWLQYLQRRRWVALGVPPVALGIQEPGGRMIGEVMFQEFITRIQKIQTQFGNIIIEQLFVPLIAARFGEKVLEESGKPTVVFKPIVEEDRNLRQARLIQAANSGVISVNEARIGMGYTTLRGGQWDTPIALVIQQAKEQMKMQEKLSETQTEQQMELMDKQVEHTRELAPYEQQRSEMDLEKQKLGLEKQKLVNQSPTGGKKPGGQPPQKMSLDMRPDAGRTKQPIKTPKKTINKKTVAIKSEQDIRDEVINVYNIVAFNLKHPGPMLVKDIRVDARERIERVIDEYSPEIGESMKRIFTDEFMGTVEDLIKNKEELQAI